jgi:hypothetical protein
VGANNAAGNGHLDVLKWLEDKGILSNELGANNAASNGHLNVVSYLIEKGIYPDEEGIINGLTKGFLGLLEILPPKLFTVSLANETAANGLLEALKVSPVLPNQIGVNQAAINGHINVLNWLENKGLLPTSEAFNLILKSHQMNDDVVEWLMDHNIYPSPQMIETIFYARKLNSIYVELLKRMVQIYPILPAIHVSRVDELDDLEEYQLRLDPESVDYALDENVDLLEELLKHGVYPSQQSINDVLRWVNFSEEEDREKLNLLKKYHLIR